MELKWNPGAHDEGVDAAKKLEMERRQQEVAGRVSRYYERWKASLQAKGKKNGMSQSALIEELYNLHGNVRKMCDYNPAMFEWRVFTMNMIEDVISRTIATECGNKNLIMEWIPESVRKAPDRVATAEQAIFLTEEELYEVPFVKRHLQDVECVGLLREGLWIRAFYRTGEFVPVGMCANTVGIKTLVTVSQMKEGLSNPGTSPQAGSPTPDGAQAAQPGTTLPTTTQGGNPSGSTSSDTPRSSDSAA